MVITGIWSNNMRYPSPECYTTFWMMTIYITPSIYQTLHQLFNLLLIWTLLSNLTFYLIVRGVNDNATDAACQHRTLNPLDTWSCPTLGLACVLMLKPISPELDFLVSNTLVLLFFFVVHIVHSTRFSNWCIYLSRRLFLYSSTCWCSCR